MPTTRRLFHEKTWSRDRLFRSVSHNTVDRSFRNPCITVGGMKRGAPCSFPFVYPDCLECFKPVGRQEIRIKVLLGERVRVVSSVGPIQGSVWVH